MRFSREQKIWAGVFGVCLLYWAYLFPSLMGIKFDAIAYEQLGIMLHQQGWVEYFRTGPNREPLYPWSISLSMGLAEMTNVPYQQFQKFGQLVMLFLTQISALFLLRNLKVRLWLQVATILYIGFSPGLLNAALSLFSEISIFPSMLMSGFCLAWSWRSIQNGSIKEVILAGTGTAFVFIAAVMGKAVFQYVFLAAMMVMALLAMWALFVHRKAVGRSALVYFLTTTILFGGTNAAYMGLNKKYNGRFEFTDRYANLLFGNAYKRTEPMSARLMMAHLASVPGGGFCRRFYSEKECAYAEFAKADEARYVQLRDLLNVPQESRNGLIFSRVKERVQGNPLQYVFLTVVEAMKAFFWESCRVGFVAYPTVVTAIYQSGWFADLLRLIVGSLTVVSVVYGVMYCFRRVRLLFEDHPEAKTVQWLFFSLLTAGVYVGLYAMFTIVQRYILPLGPVFLVASAVLLDKILLRQKR